jgi:hypothetical protein
MNKADHMIPPLQSMGGKQKSRIGQDRWLNVRRLTSSTADPIIGVLGRPNHNPAIGVQVSNQLQDVPLKTPKNEVYWSSLASLTTAMVPDDDSPIGWG